MYRYRPWSAGECLKRAFEARGHVVWSIDTRQFVRGNRKWSECWDEMKGFNAQAMILVGLQDGLPQDFKVSGLPIVYWAMTDPICTEKNLQTAKVADAICVAQKKYVPVYGTDSRYATWLPLAFDNVGVYSSVKSADSYDIAFVGSNYKGNVPQRKLWLDKLAERRRVFTSSSLFLSEMAKVYSASKIVYNYSVKDDLNMRIFEAMGCGSMLLTNRLTVESGIGDIFTEDSSYAAYSSLEELELKVSYYLGDTAARQKIASTGTVAVQTQHTFLNRADYLCGLVVNGW
jgi:O-antigen biosynthesis protein